MNIQFLRNWDNNPRRCVPHCRHGTPSHHTAATAGAATAPEGNARTPQCEIARWAGPALSINAGTAMARKPQIVLSSLDVDRIEALIAAMPASVFPGRWICYRPS